jgi:hypothetical protein
MQVSAGPVTDGIPFLLHWLITSIWSFISYFQGRILGVPLHPSSRQF